MTFRYAVLQYLLFIATTSLIGVCSVAAQDPLPAQNSDGPKEIVFAFERTPWRDVIDYLAESADLALHVGDLPTGSFTYSDRQAFSPQAAIDRVNLFLLPQGFTLVRTGSLLSVINLNDRFSAKQLNALAPMISLQDLDAKSDYEVAKCLFPLGELDAEDAITELAPLNLMLTPAVFAKTNQLLITDTAGRLKTARKILESFQPKTLDNGTVVESVQLKHVDTEDVLQVVRPHLGLATGEMIGIDVSLSADPINKTIYVTGIEDKVKLIQRLAESIDHPQKSLKIGSENGAAILIKHPVKGGNVQTIYDVLLTLLDGRDVRLSVDSESQSLVALAPASVQEEIKETVKQLEAGDLEFAVIPLKNVEPNFVLSVINQMLGLEEDDSDDDYYGYRWWEEESEEDTSSQPRIDVDKPNMRLYVRGKPYQIEQIREIVAGLEAGESFGTEGTNGLTASRTAASSATMRLFPLQGAYAVQVLETVARFWDKPNPIFLYASAGSDNLKPAEKLLHDSANSTEKSALESPFDQMLVTSPRGRLLTKFVNAKADALRCQQMPRGLLLQCADTEALDELEKQLRLIAGPTRSVAGPPIIYYLKFTRPNDALQTLAELLDGGLALQQKQNGVDTGFISDDGDYLGSIITSRDGAMTLVFGSLTIVSDSRLNRLIVQGSTNDVTRIESYLKIVDKEQGLTEIETYGRSHVIELRYTKATEVAQVIRDAYTGRIKASAAELAAATGASQARDRGKGKDNDRSGGGAGKPTRDLAPKMTIAVHEPSNSLVVTAPESLFREVEQLARQVDERGRQTVRIVDLPAQIELDRLRQILSPSQVKQPTQAKPRRR